MVLKFEKVLHLAQMVLVLHSYQNSLKIIFFSNFSPETSDEFRDSFWVHLRFQICQLLGAIFPNFFFTILSTFAERSITLENAINIGPVIRSGGEGVRKKWFDVKFSNISTILFQKINSYWAWARWGRKSWIFMPFFRFWSSSAFLKFGQHFPIFHQFLHLLSNLPNFSIFLKSSGVNKSIHLKIFYFRTLSFCVGTDFLQDFSICAKNKNHVEFVYNWEGGMNLRNILSSDLQNSEKFLAFRFRNFAEHLSKLFEIQIFKIFW